MEKKYSKGEDIGFVGEVTDVIPRFSTTCWRRISCYRMPGGNGQDFNTYNINADDAACAMPGPSMRRNWHS